MQLERIRGDTAADKFLISNEQTLEPVNLVGCILTMTLNTVRNPVDVSTQVYQLAGVVSDPVSGVVEFAPDVTQADRVGFYYYDIQLVDSEGYIRTLVKNIYQYVQDITK